MTIENVVDNQGKFGKLKFVGKVRSPFTCADCKKDFQIGDPCYDQNDYTGDGFFPEKRRICSACGDIRAEGGTPIKDKPVRPPKKNKVEANPEPVVIDPKDGCGKDTEYQKPDKSGYWKCGERAPIIGIMHCKECGGLK